MGSIREHPESKKRGSGQRWQARFRDPSGQQRARSFDRKIDARSWIQDNEVDTRRKTWVDPDNGLVPFSSYAESWAAGTAHLAPGTVEKVAGHLRTHIVPAFGSFRISDIGPADVRAWVSALTAKGLAPGTVRAVYGTFSRIMKRATVEGVVHRSPCVAIDLPRERRGTIRFLNAEEVDRLAEAIDEQYRTLIHFAAYTGSRWGEIAALKVEHLNVLRGTVDLCQSLSEVNGHLRIGPTKTGGRRTVSLPRSLREMLAEHLAAFPSPEGYVFTSPEGGPLRRSFYRRHYKPAVERAGLEPLRFHDLRHTCASLLIAQGAHAKEIAERLGHSTVRLTLDRYGHLLPSLDERLRDGLEETFQRAKVNRDVDQMWTRERLAPISKDVAGSGKGS